MGTDKRERQKAGRQARIEAARAAQLKAQRKRRYTTMAISAVVVIGALTAYSALTHKNAKGPGVDEKLSTGFVTGSGPCAPTSPPAKAKRHFDSAPRLCIDTHKKYTAVLDTSAGEIRVKLQTTQRPGTVNNFVNLAQWGYYDKTKIFRTDPSIDIIQGGDVRPGSPGPGYEIPDEGSGFHYKAGQLVMARGNAPNSASSQWFFTAGPKSSSLGQQGTYVVFGDVTKGLDVVKKILASGDTSNPAASGGLNPPKPPVTVRSVRIITSA